MKYIGIKQVKEAIETGEKTPSGVPLLKVLYEDGSFEVLSKIMYDEIAADESYDLTELRDRRVRPIVATTLVVFREWGIKVSELAYFSALLNQSLDANKDEAFKELWLKLIPNLQSIDDIDLIAIDRVLKSKQNPVPSPFSKPNDETGTTGQ